MSASRELGSTPLITILAIAKESGLIFDASALNKFFRNLRGNTKTMKHILLTLLLTLLATSAPAQIRLRQQRGVDVYAPVATVTGVTTLPITMSSTPPTAYGGIISFQFNLHYDPAVVIPTGDNFGCSTSKTVAANLIAVCNIQPEGRLRVAVYGAYGFTEPGTILNIDFLAVGAGESPLTFTDAFLHEGDPISIWHDGVVFVK